jgi:imidazolonepropionase-like amidohydrolase
MKRTQVTAVAGLALIVAGSVAWRAATAQDGAYAFVDVTVLPMDTERRLDHQTVVVTGGRISALGAAATVRVPDGATRIDGRGKFLMPGFAEMHAHLPNPATAPAEVVERVLFLYIANGVTTARGMLGNPLHLALRDSIARGQLLGPRLFVAGPALGGGTVPTPADGARMAREQRAAGYDHIKIQEGLSAEAYDSIVAAARAAGIRFAGHVPDAVGVARVLAAGQATVDHFDNYAATLDADGAVSDEEVAALIAATKAAGAAVVPTMALWETFRSTTPVDSLRQRPELRYVPPQWVDNWATAVGNMRRSATDPAAGQRELEIRRRVLRAAAEGGVLILFGTDSPQLFSVPGFSIHREARAMAATGLTPFQILAAGTRNVADFYGARDDFGTVAPGRRADLILLDADPLVDVANLERRAGVMVAGRWLPEAEIRARLAEIAAAR